MIEKSTLPDGGLHLKVLGRFNFACYREFHDAVAGAAPARFVVDLSQAEYLDSSALGMLLLLRDKVNGDTRRVALMGSKGQPAEVLRLANFDKLFQMA